MKTSTAEAEMTQMKVVQRSACLTLLDSLLAGWRLTGHHLFKTATAQSPAQSCSVLLRISHELSERHSCIRMLRFERWACFGLNAFESEPTRAQHERSESYRSISSHKWLLFPSGRQRISIGETG
jgi:hypothetical protein